MAGADNVVRNLICKILEESKIKQKKVEIKPLNTEGANYTTALYTIKVDTEDENLSLFAKVASISEGMRKHINADRFYQTESFVYLNLVKIYEALQQKYDIPKEYRFVFPKFFGIEHQQGQETVLLENLTSKGYKSYNRFKSMDWEHAAVSVELLARFHALSFAYNADNPEEFNQLAATMVYKTYPEDESSEETLSVWVKMVDRALEVIDEEHKDKIRELMMNKEFIKKYNKPSSNPVLCHGDYRLSNILFRREGEILQAIPVDYQTLYTGCPPGDLVYFIVMGSDEEFRRQYFDRLVDHYYDNLCQALQRFHVDHVEAYPRKTFDEQMKEVLPYALFLGVAILPVVTVEAGSGPRMDGEADVSTFIVEPNALYASRFRGIVNDCLRWGVI